MRITFNSGTGEYCVCIGNVVVYSPSHIDAVRQAKAQDLKDTTKRIYAPRRGACAAVIAGTGARGFGSRPSEVMRTHGRKYFPR